MNDTNVSDKEALEKFIVDNSELEKLEELTSRFNIFESLDIAKQEIRHSNFLAWAMNPNESHGLGDYFLKKFLLRTTSLANRRGLGRVTPIQIDISEFDEAKVQREWESIDIIIIDEKNRFVCVIENKVEAAEHSDQLNRYEALVEREFPDFTKQFIFLTPDARRASNDSYLNIGYDDICDIIEYIIRAKGNLIGDEVRIFLSHYTEMLRRQVMVNSEIQDLCKSIYEKHQKALDLILEHKPDLQTDIRNYLVELIGIESELVLDYSSKSGIGFGVKAWDVERLLKGEGLESRRLLFFEFWNHTDILSLSLVIGRGDTATRKQVYDIAKSNPNLFKKAVRKLTRQWFTIYSEKFLSQSDYERATIEKLRPKIEKKWKSFLSADFRQIVGTIEEKFALK